MSELSTRARQWLETLLSVAECCERDAEQGIGESEPEYWRRVAGMHRYLLRLVRWDETSDGRLPKGWKAVLEDVTPWTSAGALDPAELAKFTNGLRREEMAMSGAGCEATQEPTLGHLAAAEEEIGKLVGACHSHLGPLDNRLVHIATRLGGTFGSPDKAEPPTSGASKGPPGVIGRILATQHNVRVDLLRLQDQMGEVADVVTRIEHLLSVPECDAVSPQRQATR